MATFYSTQQPITHIHVFVSKSLYLEIMIGKLVVGLSPLNFSVHFGLCNCGTMKKHKTQLQRDDLCKSVLSFSLYTSMLQAAGSINTEGEKKHSHLQD
jgi:hypothetical protein